MQLRISRPCSSRTQQPARCQFPTIRLGCVLPQMARIILCKTGLDPIWFWLTVRSVRPNGSGLKQAGVREPSGPFASEPIKVECESYPACLTGKTGVTLRVGQASKMALFTVSHTQLQSRSSESLLRQYIRFSLKSV